MRASRIGRWSRLMVGQGWFDEFIRLMVERCPHVILAVSWRIV